MTRDEAINIVRNIYQTDAEREALATLIPELAESDDERIRKWLYEYIDAHNWRNDYTVSKEEALAYLKKQKDYRKLYENITKSEWFKKNYVGKSLGEYPYDFAMSQQEKQKDQNISKEGMKKKKSKFKVGDRIRTLEKDDEGIGPMYEDEIVSIGDDGSYKLKHLGELYLPESEWELVNQRKPYKCNGCNNYKGCINCVDGDQWAHIIKPAEEHCDLTELLVPPQLPQNLASGDSEKPNNKHIKWGEGEEKVLDTMIKDYENISKSFCGHSAKIEFLKSLKNGEYGLPNTKSNQWSKEDEAKKERLISIVKRVLQGNKFPLLNNEGATELIDWLNSHCPSWKPSEEQMNTLKSCFHINPATGEPHSPSLDEIYMLGSLYNDLLKNYKL